jgi:hypothetical protein
MFAVMPVCGRRGVSVASLGVSGMPVASMPAASMAVASVRESAKGHDAKSHGACRQRDQIEIHVLNSMLCTVPG